MSLCNSAQASCGIPLDLTPYQHHLACGMVFLLPCCSYKKVQSQAPRQHFVVPPPPPEVCVFSCF